MSAVFQDLQSKRNPNNSRTLDERSTINVLGELRRSPAPVMCQFEASDGSNLTIGVGADYGCAQYTKDDGLPPYFMAVLEAERGSPMEFLVADTRTPIDGRYRLSWSTLEQVSVYFVTTGERSPSVRWEEFQPG